MSGAFGPAQLLRENRPLLLAMEAIGWFHMVGKARVEFLRAHGGVKLSYEYKQWHKLEHPPFPWDSLLGWVRQLYGGSIPTGAWPVAFAEFTEKHGGGATKTSGLLGLLQAAHGVVSGVEKNLPPATSGYLRQSALHMWVCSPWGYPKRNLLLDPPEVLSPDEWARLVAEIRRVLDELRDLGTQGHKEVSLWHRWRERAIGPASLLRRAFLSTLAETRLPNNDVLLWDQSYVAAALFKSAVAGALLDSGFPWTDTGISRKATWRLLTVAVPTVYYEARSVKIGDWTGIRRTLEQFFRRVANLMEVDLAVGALLYQDTEAAVFSFPGEYGQSPQRFPADAWRRWLEEQIDRIAIDLDLELPPCVRMSEPSRSLVPLVRECAEARDAVMVPVRRQWDVRWSVPKEASGHLCAVCGLRLNGSKIKARPCGVCRSRRHHRRDDWLRGALEYDSLWFEEVADSNDRIALLSVSIELSGWLNGERVDSLRAQAIPEWRAKNKKVATTIENHTKRWSNLLVHDRLVQYMKRRIDNRPANIATDAILRALIPGLKEEFSNSRQGTVSWMPLYNRLVEDRALSPRWHPTDNLQNAKWFVFQSFRKLPSPGRVYRFWREAEAFFRDLLREFRQMSARSANPWRTRRLVLVPRASAAGVWQDLNLYNGRWRGAPLSLVYVNSLGGFVTASNLGRILEPHEKKEAFLGAEIVVEEEDESGKTRSIQVEKAREPAGAYAHLGVYSPLIPLEISPMRFRVIVPLETASECLDLAIQRWKDRFARVWDRLPLRAGVIAFPRTLPYQAVVEAARTLEECLQGEEETWYVEEVERTTGELGLRLKRRDRQSTLRLVPSTMPDGREDVFYPYVVVEDKQLRFPRDFSHPQDGRVYRHMADLRPGDGIRVSPGRVATWLLDSTAARFGQPNLRYLEEWTQMRETWEILVRVSPSQTALQRLRSMLSRLETEWQPPPGGKPAPGDLYQDMVRALLAEHLNTRGAVLETLTERAVSGVLTWTLDWHLTSLRERARR